MKTKTLETLEEGKVVKGVIKNITEYGAFVDLGGIDGLLHITDMSWGRVNHPSELFQVGDEVTVKVLKYNAETERVSPRPQADPGRPVEPRRRGVPAGQEGPRQGHVDHRLRRVRRARAGRRRPHPRQRDELDQEGQAPVASCSRSVRRSSARCSRSTRKAKRISLGLKQLEPDPWTLFTEKYHPGDKIGGKVRSLTDYGVFIGIEEGVDGMVHKSDLSWTAKVNNPATSTTRATTSRPSSSRSTTTRRRSPSASSSSGTTRGRPSSSEFPPGKVVEGEGHLASSTTACSCACATASRGSSPQNEIVEPKDEDGEAEAAQDRRRGQGRDREHRHAGAPPHALACASASAATAAATTTEAKPAASAHVEGPQEVDGRRDGGGRHDRRAHQAEARREARPRCREGQAEKADEGRQTKDERSSALGRRRKARSTKRPQR